MPAANSDLSSLFPLVLRAVATITLVLQAAEAGTAASPGAHAANSPLVFPGRDTFSTRRTPDERGENRYAVGSANRI